MPYDILVLGQTLVQVMVGSLSSAKPLEPVLTHCFVISTPRNKIRRNLNQNAMVGFSD